MRSTGSGPGRRVAADRVLAPVRRAPVLAFFAAMFAWSWGYWALVGRTVPPGDVSWVVTLPGLWGPVVAAAVVTRATDGSVRAFFRRTLARTTGWRWLVGPVAAVLALDAASTLVVARLAGVGVQLDVVSPLVTLAVAVVAGGSEEFGLRGVAHPLLRDRHGGLVAGVAIGFLWVLWHVPLHALGIGYDGPFLLFAGIAVAIAVLLGWLHDRTGATVAPVVLAHAAFDAPSVLEPVGDVARRTVLVGELTQTVVLWLVVLALVARHGRRLVPEHVANRPGALAD